MKRSRTVRWTALAGAGVAFAIAGIAVSAGNPMEERQATMKQVGQTMKESTAFTFGLKRPSMQLRPKA